jgi:hypothetical protein
VTAEPRILQGVGHRLLRDRPQRPAPATNPRHHGTPKTPDMFRKGTTLKITMIAALSIATAATALPMAAIAHADVLAGFQSPSGDIGCSMRIGSNGKGGVTCEVRATPG